MKPIIITVGDGPPLTPGTQILVRGDELLVDFRQFNYRTWTPAEITHPGTKIEVRDE